MTLGVASGDVTSTSAVVWARSDSDSTMQVRYQIADGRRDFAQVAAQASSAGNFAAQVILIDLEPDIDYTYEIWFENDAGRSETASGAFRTAPVAETPTEVAFVWSGDLGGQRYCRRDPGGYAIFRVMAALEPGFFVANGDMIYADNDCPLDGPVEGWTNIPGDFPGIASPDIDWEDAEEVEAVYAAHWRYNREDPAFQEFLSQTPMFVQWDDHEVINDFGAPWPEYPPAGDRPGFPAIVAAGRKTLFDFHPIRRVEEDPDRIYRSFRWGRDLELFILDARSYRSENALEDSPENAKTMLGEEQRTWLETALADSEATWKMVSTDVPLSAPTGAAAFGRDAFANADTATGFESELLDLVAALDMNDVRNVVFIATDVHYPAQLRYELDADGDGDLILFHELISGPLSAVRGSPPEFDPTLGPTVLYSEGNLFNFGTVRIGDGGQGAAHLWTDIRDEAGGIRPGSELELVPED